MIILEWLGYLAMMACIVTLVAWLLLYYVWRPVFWVFCYVAVAYAAWQFIRAIERPHAFRLGNRKDPLLCPNCHRERMHRYSYGSQMLWSCHACHHVQFDWPGGVHHG